MNLVSAHNDHRQRGKELRQRGDDSLQRAVASIGIQACAIGLEASFRTSGVLCTGIRCRIRLRPSCISTGDA